MNRLIQWKYGIKPFSLEIIPIIFEYIIAYTRANMLYINNKKEVLLDGKRSFLRIYFWIKTNKKELGYSWYTAIGLQRVDKENIALSKEI